MGKQMASSTTAIPSRDGMVPEEERRFMLDNINVGSTKRGFLVRVATETFFRANVGHVSSLHRKFRRGRLASPATRLGFCSLANRFNGCINY